MKISAINYQTNPHFAGENKKTNKLKNAAGAAAIAIAAAAPMADADAQIYPLTTQPYPYEIPVVSIPSNYNYATVPNCFIVGDITKAGSNKSMRRVFDEIDGNGNENGVISAKEVLRTERKNWNKTNLYPYSGAQMQAVQNQFRSLSELYNEDNSDPATMNYREYKAAMEDYMETKDTKAFIDLLQILTIPYLYQPYPYYHHHHYHRPPHPPRHNHRYDPPPVHRHW